MTGDLVVDNQQHRICKVKGHLIHDVTFGGGLLGRLKERSSFALEQQQVGPSVWELTAIHVHLEGNALLFKSVSLQQDDKRSRFQPEPANVTLEQAATSVMSQPELFAVRPAKRDPRRDPQGTGLKVIRREETTGCHKRSKGASPDANTHAG